MSSKPFKWWSQLFPKQKEAAVFAIDRLKKTGGVGLFSQQRTGKTYITLSIIEKLIDELGPIKVLVICPLIAVDAVWAPKLATLGELVDPGMLVKSSPGSSFSVCHPQGLPRHMGKLKRGLHKIDLVVIDESQGAKSRGTINSRQARVFRKARFRIALTGTPIDEDPIEVWAQMRFIDHRVLGERWLLFKKRFCYRSGFGGYTVKFRKAKLNEFIKLIKPYVFRLTIGFLNLPEPKFHYVPVYLLSLQAAAYREMDRKSIVKIDDDTFVADMRITKDVRLQQITGGFISNDEKTVFLGRAKLRKTISLINKLDKPVVVFCNFLWELALLSEAIDRSAILSGKTRDRNKLLKAFNDGQIDALLCQYRTGGVAIDLTRSYNLILYSIDYSFINFEQAIFRLLGVNQTRQLNIFVVYAHETIDETKIDMVNEKASKVLKIVSSLERKE